MPSDMPPGAFPPDHGQHRGSAPSDASTPSAQSPTAPPMTFGRPPRWPAFTALLIALIALAVGIAAWFRPASHSNQHPPKPAYTQQQIADAKSKVCAAFGKLDRASEMAKAQAIGSDQLAIDINTRQIFDVFSRYLRATLSEEPASPPDLANAVREQASTLEEAVIDYEVGLRKSDPEMKPLFDANNASADTIRRLCK